MVARENRTHGINECPLSLFLNALEKRFHGSHRPTKSMVWPLWNTIRAMPRRKSRCLNRASAVISPAATPEYPSQTEQALKNANSQYRSAPNSIDPPYYGTEANYLTLPMAVPTSITKQKATKSQPSKILQYDPRLLVAS